MAQDLTVADSQAILNAIIDSRRVALPGDVWVQVMNILRVPVDRREADARHLSDILSIGAFFHATDENKAEYAASLKKLERVGTLADALRTELLDLDGAARFRFECNALGLDAERALASGVPKRFAQGLMLRTAVSAGRFGRHERHERAVQQLDDIVTAATDGRGALPRIGRPPRSMLTCPRECAFDLVVMLLYRAAAERGWHLTLSHNFESGTLVDVLGILKPHLAQDLIPNVLNMKRLRNLRSAHARAVNTPRNGPT